MSIKYLKTVVLCLFSLTLTTGHAQQKEIVLDSDLQANAERMKVKMGTQWMGKIWKFKFGDYAVTDSKSGWMTTTSHKKMFSFKESSVTEQEFSFELEDGTGDKAVSNVAFSLASEALVALFEFGDFAVGTDAPLSGSQNFSAMIYTGSMEEDVWVLVLNKGSNIDGEESFTGFLTNRQQTIHIYPTSSNKEGNDSRSMPALGYEFVEGERALCAMQYYGGGALGYNKNVIWLRSDLDQHQKLILAAAMTSLLQTEVTVMGGMD